MLSALRTKLCWIVNIANCNGHSQGYKIKLTKYNKRIRKAEGESSCKDWIRKEESRSYNDSEIGSGEENNESPNSGLVSYDIINR